MSEIINSYEFDRIYHRIVYREKLEINFIHYEPAEKNRLIEDFLQNNCYIVTYENQEFYVLTDAYYTRLNLETDIL